jgi:hypothetical protein
VSASAVTLVVEFTFVIERPGVCPRFGVWWPEAEVELPIRAEVTDLDSVRYVDGRAVVDHAAPCVIWCDLAVMQDLIAQHEITPDELAGIEEAAIGYFDEARMAGKLGVTSVDVSRMSPRELIDAVKAQLGAA